LEKENRWAADLSKRSLGMRCFQRPLTHDEAFLTQEPHEERGNFCRSSAVVLIHPPGVSGMGMDDDDPFLSPEASRAGPEKSPATLRLNIRGDASSEGGKVRSDILVTRSFTMWRAELRGESGSTHSSLVLQSRPVTMSAG